MKYPPRALAKDQADAILKAAIRPRDRALIVLLWRAGLRAFEATALLVSDVTTLDCASLELHIQNGKGGKARHATIDPTSARHIAPMLSGNGYILRTRTGEELQTSNVRRTVARLALTAGIARRVHPHAFRHTFAAELMREGFTLAEIRDAMGHTNAATTEAYLKSLGQTQLFNKLRRRSL